MENGFGRGQVTAGSVLLRLGGLPPWAAAVLASVAEADGPLVAHLRAALAGCADLDGTPPAVTLQLAAVEEEEEAPTAAAVTVPEKDKNGGFDVDSLDAALLRRLGGDYDFDLQAFFDEQRIGGTQSRLRWLAQAHGVLSEAEAELGVGT